MPEAQSEQIEAEEDDIFPRAQRVHEPEDAALYFPGSQLLQEDAPASVYKPARQSTQITALYADADFPGAHEVQEVAASVSEKEPAKQDLQDVWAAASW